MQTVLGQEIPDWNAVETRTDPGKMLGIDWGVDLRGPDGSTELGMGLGIRTHIA